jgi:uncharacterized protein YdaU (DUF1376 family)
MGSVPMQQWYPDSHVADTGSLNLEQQGAYRLLMDHMWIKGGCLPDDDQIIARYLRIDVRKWRRLKGELAGFLLIQEGIITQKRLQRDYQDAKSKSKTNAENGAKGGRKTAEKWQIARANALAKDEQGATASRSSNGSGQHIGDVLQQLELEPKPEL